MTLLLEDVSIDRLIVDPSRRLDWLDSETWSLFAGRRRDVPGTWQQRGDWSLVSFADRQETGGDRFAAWISAAAGQSPLDYGWKWALAPGDTALQLQAEWPASLVPRLSPKELELLLNASDQILDRQSCPFHDESHQCDAVPPVGFGESSLAERIEATGWTFHARPGERFAIPLETAPVYCEAIVTRDASGSLKAETEWDAGDLSFHSAVAMAVLILRANRIFRMVRFSMTYSERVDQRFAGVRVRCVVWLPAIADAGELAEALAALSVACRGGLQELQLMVDERTARLFLAVQGMVPGRE